MIRNFIKSLISPESRKEKYLKNLIKRMYTTDNAKSSDVSVSYKAHREAEALSDNEMIPILIELISNSNKAEHKMIRKEAYFILSKLLIKNKDLGAIQFLINQLNLETDDYIISSLLDQLSDIEKPVSVDLEPIYQYIQQRSWSIRHSAIRSLKKSRNQEGREVILNLIITNKEDIKRNKYDIIYAVSTLSDIGKNEDLSLLEELSAHKIRDIRESAGFAIKCIKDRTN